jgi:hypothetical protein
MNALSKQNEYLTIYDIAELYNLNYFQVYNACRRLKLNYIHRKNKNDRKQSFYKVSDIDAHEKKFQELSRFKNKKEPCVKLVTRTPSKIIRFTNNNDDLEKNISLLRNMFSIASSFIDDYIESKKYVCQLEKSVKDLSAINRNQENILTQLRKGLDCLSSCIK